MASGRWAGMPGIDGTPAALSRRRSSCAASSRYGPFRSPIPPGRKLRLYSKRAAAPRRLLRGCHRKPAGGRGVFPGAGKMRPEKIPFCFHGGLDSGDSVVAGIRGKRCPDAASPGAGAKNTQWNRRETCALRLLARGQSGAHSRAGANAGARAHAIRAKKGASPEPGGGANRATGAWRTGAVICGTAEGRAIFPAAARCHTKKL